MLQLHQLLLYQFKNYLHDAFKIQERIVCFCGNNGVGKTNLLDAIYYLCFTKSYFNSSDAASVHAGLQGMRVEGKFTRSGADEKIVCILRENNKKEVKRNGENYKRFSQHIGQFPAVMIAPDDVELITGNSDIRRRFADTLISQLDPDYLQSLIDYNRLVQQRNSLLKAAQERGYIDEALLEIINEQLTGPGNSIYEKRKGFLTGFLNEVTATYHQIAGSTEKISIEYDSQLHENDLGSLLGIFKQKDLALQRTTVGIHKDDITISFNNQPFKTIASQGQRKSLLFALKLTEFAALKNAKEFAPILLLDDVFEKLDPDRMHNLLQQVCVENTGQVFITDTHKERLQQELEKIKVDFQLIELTER